MTSRRVHPGVWRLGGGLLALAALAALPAAPAARAQEPSRAAASLDLVPDDALFYSASLRTREQIEALVHSKAWARLVNLPAVKMAREKVEEAWDQPGGPLSKVREWYAQKDNRQLVALLGDMFSDEVFTYGGSDTADFFALMGDLQTANQWGPLAALLEGKDPAEVNNPQGRVKFLVRALAENANRIKAPDVVMGFRLRDAKRARAQLRRLDQLVQGLIQQQPQLEGRWKKAKIAGGEFHTLRLDGSLVPWEHVPWQMLEDKEGELDNLKKKLRDLKLSLSVGLRGNFLIVAVGPSPARLKALGEGKRLAECDEFKRLAPFADRPLTDIAYSSKEWAALLAGRNRDTGRMVQELLDRVGKDNLTPQQRERMRKDLKAFARDMKKYQVEPAAGLSFSFLTGRGYESYAFGWGKEPAAPSGPLTALQHVGGAPLLFAVTREENDPEEYKLLVKWIRTGLHYAEEVGLPHLPPEQRQQYDQFMKVARPLLARLNKATGEMLLPGLGRTGESALVLDAHMKSKQWHQAMAPSEKALPLPAPALVLTVKDAELVRQAGHEYREVLNGFLALAGKGHLKEVPPPEERKVKDGTLYFFPLEELGVDRQLAPTAGLSEGWLVLSMGPSQAKRLLEPTPLQLKTKLLAKSERLLSAAHLNWSGLVGALTPWVDYGLDVAGVDNVAGQDVRGQIHTVLEVLRCLRGSTSVTYVQDGAVVTHGQTIIRDIE